MGLNDVWISCECGDPNCSRYQLDKLGMHPFFVPFDKAIYQNGGEAKQDPVSSSIPFGIAKNSSWDFDGERTDLNDLFAVLWGMYLRCRGIANVALFSERGFTIETEISARAVIPVDWGQIFDSWNVESQKLLLGENKCPHACIHSCPVLQSVQMSQIGAEETF